MTDYWRLPPRCGLGELAWAPDSPTNRENFRNCQRTRLVLRYL